MSLSSRFHFLVGTPQVVDIWQLAAFMTIAKVTRSVTVKINNSLGGAGFGVIINKQGNIYTVLTAERVVAHAGIEYVLQTNIGQNYAVTKVIRLQQSESQSRVALVQFVSPDAYPVATFGNSEDAPIGTNIYISGYPSTICTGRKEFTFTNGIIVDSPNEQLLRYNAPTWSGMSGAPLFNASLQLIGIHLAREVDLESRTDFNMAVPINICIALLNQTELSCAGLKLAPTQATKDSKLRISRNNSQAYSPVELAHAELGCTV